MVQGIWDSMDQEIQAEDQEILRGETKVSSMVAKVDYAWKGAVFCELESR